MMPNWSNDNAVVSSIPRYIKQPLVFGNCDKGSTQNVSGPKFHLPTMEYLVVIAFGRGIWS